MNSCGLHVEDIVPSTALPRAMPNHRPIDLWLLLGVFSYLMHNAPVLESPARSVDEELSGTVPPPASGGLPPLCLRRILNHIEANLNSKIGPRDLAKIARVSEFYFIRCFKKSTGLTPHRFIMRQRAERAKTY